MKTPLLLLAVTCTTWLIMWCRYRLQIHFWRGMYREESNYSHYLFDLFDRTNRERLKLLIKTRTTNGGPHEANNTNSNEDIDDAS